MKKAIVILLTLALVLVAFAACGGNNTEEGTTAASADETTAASDAENTTEATPLEGKTVKAGFIFLHDENLTYDLNFIKGATEACEKLGIEMVVKKNIPETAECYETAADLVDLGCNFIFADSFGHEDFIIQAAREFPDVQFAHATGTKAHTEGLANYHNAFASIYEGRYLAGVAAGLKLNEMIEKGDFTAEEAKIGYVCAFTYAEIISGYTSFFLGARSVCPTATMEVQFTGSWSDEAGEKEAATTLINNNCKLISQHVDTMGVPTACETAGVPNVAYNGSTVAACPNTFIVSSRINWAPYMEYAMTCVAEGKEIDADWTGTLATGSVQLSDINEQAAAAGTADKLAEVKAGLEDGSIKVFDTETFTVNGAKLETHKADVDTDADYTPDTEVVSEGVFNESKFRSAPYFDLRIDGITLLNEKY